MSGTSGLRTRVSPLIVGLAAIAVLVVGSAGYLVLRPHRRNVSVVATLPPPTIRNGSLSPRRQSRRHPLSFERPRARPLRRRRPHRPPKPRDLQRLLPPNRRCARSRARPSRHARC
jgi:hypothetical protein